jgi:dGTPase
MMEWKKLLSRKRVGELSGKLPSEEDARTPFERDYGRAVFCTPVRRLQDKTQVFPLEEHDAVRTRLTHSLEVSSVARSLGREVGRWLRAKEEISEDQVHDIETISATSGLIHDLGNPPFGHSGEDAIQTWFKSKLSFKRNEAADHIFEGTGEPGKDGLYGNSQYANDFLKWEGNAQTLRLISRLQVLADQHGINLTCATFSAACKYTARSHEIQKGNHEKSKPGFFASEEETVKQVSNETGTSGHRHPITHLVEASDDIVYSTGDIEDGVRKGILDWEFLVEELEKNAPNSAVLKHVISEAVKKVNYKRWERPRRDEEVAQAFRTISIAAMKKEVFEYFCKVYESVMRGTYKDELGEDPECGASEFIQACKKVGVAYVYPSRPTLKLELMGRRVIHDLMDVFWEGAKDCGGASKSSECKKGFPGKAFSLISRNYKTVFEQSLKEGRPERYCRLQLVTDQIAGMTDTFAIMTHKRLMNG